MQWLSHPPAPLAFQCVVAPGQAGESREGRVKLLIPKAEGCGCETLGYLMKLCLVSAHNVLRTLHSLSHLLYWGGRQQSGYMLSVGERRDLGLSPDSTIPREFQEVCYFTSQMASEP